MLFRSQVLRQGAAGLLVLFGITLLVPRWQQAFANATSRLSTVGDGLLSRTSSSGWVGQFSVGLVLGIIWSPCVGPTLGAATTLAATGTHLGQIALLMVLFGLGAGTPLVLIGTLSREATLRVRGKLMAAGQRGKWVLGGLLLLVGVSILTGWDKGFETWVLDHSPDWLTNLTTRF